MGSQSVRRLVEAGYHVIGLENDMRSRLFGPEASTAPLTAAPATELVANVERWTTARV